MPDIDEMLERSLKEAAASYRPSPPPSDAVIARYHRRRALNGAVTLGLLLAIAGGVAYGVRTVRDAKPIAPASEVVPWRPLTPAEPSPEPSVSPAPAGLADCRATQLRATLIDEGGAAGGHVSTVIAIANVSDDACVVHGVPALLLSTTSYAAAPQRAGTYFPDSGDIRIELKPRMQLPRLEQPKADLTAGHGLLTFEWFDCDPTTQVTNLAIGLRDGRGDVPVATPIAVQRSGAAGCEGATGPTAVAINNFDGVPSERPMSPYVALEARLDGPATARRGAKYRFTVTLRNPRTAAIAFENCPNYVEQMSGSGIKIVRSWRLNCSEAPVIPAHGAIAFEMILDVPESTRTGDALLLWEFEPPDSRTPNAAPLSVRIV